jgi:hypothetical protein
VNVASSSIAPALPSASPSPSGVQSASDEGTPGTFAKTMQLMQQASATQQTSATQPKDASRKSTLTLEAQPEDHSVDQVAAFPSAFSQAVSSFKQAQSFAHMQAASHIDSTDGEPGSRDGNRDLSSVSTQEEMTGSGQLPASKSAPLNAEAEVAPLQPDSDPVQHGAAAFAPIDADPAITDAVASNSVSKTASAGNNNSTKKTLHAREANPEFPTTTPASHADRKPEVSKAAEAVAAASPQNAAVAVEQDASGTTAVLIAIKPTGSSSTATDAIAALKSSAPASQTGKGKSVVQASDATTGAMQLAGPGVPAVIQSAAAQSSATQVSSSDSHADARFAENAFSAGMMSSADATQPAAVFAPSLSIQPPPTDRHSVAADVSSASVSSTVSSTLDVPSSQAVPVRRLEIAIQDPLLGNVDVRAEMRGGALHATLTGSQDSATASISALHQFLQQHDVTVHSLTYATGRDGVTASASTTLSSGDMRRDTDGGSFAGSQNSGSQTSGGDEPRQQQRYRSFNTADEDGSFAPVGVPRPLGFPAAMTANNMLGTGSTLSIHI